MTRKRLSLLGAALSVFAALITAVTTVGQQASTPQVLILFFGGFGAGAALVAALRDRGRRS